MFATSTRLIALALLALGLLWSTLGTAPPDAALAGAAADTRELLQGTWLRDYTEDGVRVRRILALAPGGTFHESVRVTQPGGSETGYVHDGTWLYDGTNLKRKYTSMNGRPPSRLNVPFATFEVTFESRNEFVGVDHIHRHRVVYRRVEAGTLP